MDGDEVEGVKWDAWNRALANIAGIVAIGGRRDDDALTRLYEIAVELRDRLRYSQGRVRSLKQELHVTIAAARSERHEAMARLQELETEVARLAGAVQAQGSTLAARETVSQSQVAENDQLRRRVAAMERQLQRAEEDRLVTVSERNDALRHLEKMTQLLEESEGRVSEVQAEHNGLLGELVATKGRLADMSALETLYGAARDELERLDKENLELKDMVTSGGVQLGRSRILEALGIESSDVFASPRVGGGGGGRRGARASSPVGGSGGSRSRSAPRISRGSPSSGRGSYGKSLFMPDAVPAPTDSYRGTTRPYSARALSPPGRGAGLTSSPSACALAPTGGPGNLVVAAPNGAGSAAPSGLEDPVSEMAFLGPPSSAYPPDPENYVFYRTGGGYTPRLNPAQPTTSQPRASGWVPKDVVRLIQAFRHSYGISLEWRFWEPLVLMIDEVYRSRADGTLAAMKAAQQEKIKAVKRQVRAALGYPTALANGKINYLQRQLNSARKVLAIGDRKGEAPLKQMALKDYQLGYQLDRAVEENFALRRSLEDLEGLYSAAVDSGAGRDGREGGLRESRETRESGREVRESGSGSGAFGLNKTGSGGRSIGVGVGTSSRDVGGGGSRRDTGDGVDGGERGGGGGGVRLSDAYTQLSPRISASQLSPRRLQQHQHQHQHQHHRHGGSGHHHQHHHHHRLGHGSHLSLNQYGEDGISLGMGLPMSRGGGGGNRASEAAFSRRTSMASAMPGVADVAIDTMSLGGVS